MAPRDIIGGAEYGDIIDDAIHHSKVVVILFSKNANQSQWVKSELNVGFSCNKAIVPYRIDDTPLEGAMRLILNDKHWINADKEAKDPKYEDLVTAVYTALQIPEQEREKIQIPKKIDPKKKLFIMAAVIFFAFALLGSTFAIRKNHSLARDLTQYQQAIYKGDSLKTLDFSHWPCALTEYSSIMEIHQRIPPAHQVDLEMKMNTVQNRIDSLFYKIVEDGDAFASLNTETGKDLALEQYEKALKLKKSEAVQIKINQLTMFN